MSVNPEQDVETGLRREIARLTDEFRGSFSPETVDRCIRESLDGLAGAPVDTYLPTLAARFARERLTAVAQAEGMLAKDRPEVLFVCVHNAGRSQMAAALTDHLSGGRVHARSAGSQPADQINLAVTEVMRDLGVDLSREFPKPLTDEVVRAADVIVTMGCGDACPIYPGKKYQDWQVEDPHGQPIEKVREIRDAIRTRVEALLVEMGILSPR